MYYTLLPPQDSREVLMYVFRFWRLGLKFLWIFLPDGGNDGELMNRAVKWNNYLNGQWEVKCGTHHSSLFCPDLV